MFLDNSVVANGIAWVWGVSVFQDGSWSATAGLAPAEACLETRERRHRPISPDFAGRLRRPAKSGETDVRGGTHVLVYKHRSTGASPVVTKSKSLKGVSEKREVYQGRAT